MADIQIAVIDEKDTQIALAVPGIQGPAGAISSGGSANQVFYKVSGTNYDAGWTFIGNANVDAAAAIAGTKISPNFGSQAIVTTGTNTAASFIPTSSSIPSNGIYLPGANQVGVATNGTGRVFVDATGLVGIGTSAPSAQFVVGSGNTLLGHNTLDNYGGRVDIRSAYSARAANVPAQLFVADSAGSQLINTGGAIDLGGYQDQFSRAYSYARIQGLATSSSGLGGYLSFMVLSGGGSLGERVRIDTAGNVGINTTSPATTLDVNGDVTITDKIIHGGDTNTAIRFPAADTVSVETAGSERARIDSSGRLLVGTSSARSNFFNGALSAIFQVEGANAGNNRSSSFVYGQSNASGPIINLGKHRSDSVGGITVVAADDQIGSIAFQGSDGTDFVAGAQISAFVDGTPGADDMPGRLVFSTTADGAASPTDRMRITSGGDVIINGATSGAGARFAVLGGSATTPYFSVESTNTSAFGAIKFLNGNGEIGSISMLSTGVNYNTSSDYRLKENVSAVTDSINRLLQLKPSRFNFIADPDRTVDGFIAHEAQAVVPECATGEKDEVDDDGNPVYQGIDQAKLVPLLTAALQEAIAKIESLEARLTAAGI